MRHRFHGRKACQRFTAALVLAAGLTFPARIVGQERVDPMATTVGQWFAMIEHSFIALADAMPAGRYGFKPTDGAFQDVRTFGEQVKHVACSNFAFFNEIEKNNGIRIPKEATVSFPTYLIHHDEQFYPDPEKFNPDR